MRFWDKVIIILAVLGILGGFLNNYYGYKDNVGNNIVISVNNKVVKTIPRYGNDKIYDFKFKNQVGYVEVKNGAVRMLEMNKQVCPEKICSDTGWIDKSHQSIVCLPNKIVVNFESSGTGEVDSVSI